MTAAGRSAPVRRRVRLARGPVTIGEPAAAIEARLAAAEPYRPDTIADGGTAFGLTVRAASVRGLYKRYTGGPRQDDICLRLHADSETLIAAVADGVSGASRSDLGAALAVRYSTAAVARQLDSGTGGIDWGGVFEQAAWALVEEHRRACGDAGAGVEEASWSLATTLLVAAVRGSDVEVAAVGDSPAFLLTGRVYDAVVAEPERFDGLVGGGVDALPRSPGPPSVSTRSLDSGSVLLLCTDGLAMPLAGGDGEVGATLARELSRPPDVVDFARLLDFSRSTYDDDRSLVAVWGPAR
ncbi:MAG TPA: protein phosphatase 2C domain-containing protein [Solirubrobacteraceae bacterium]|nr:protein phosphatase 2C domain-containing protein [Solirubrobacteraceae bacterium]